MSLTSFAGESGLIAFVKLSLLRKKIMFTGNISPRHHQVILQSPNLFIYW